MPASFPAEALRGAIIGGAIGDVLGGISERCSLALSDDTQFTLATCEAIIEQGRPEPASIAERMLVWFREGRISGIGSSTLKAMRDLSAGNHWALSGARGERAAGNGSAMRIAPAAFFLDPAIPTERTTIRDLARITHQHDEAYVGALAVVMAVRRAAANERVSAEEIATSLPDSRVRDNLLRIADGRPLTEMARAIGTSGFVAETVPVAFAVASRILADGFEATPHVLNGIGGDTDTIGSIAGQIAGAALRGAVPAELISDVPGVAEVFRIAGQFALMASGEIT